MSASATQAGLAPSTAIVSRGRTVMSAGFRSLVLAMVLGIFGLSVGYSQQPAAVQESAVETQEKDSDTTSNQPADQQKQPASNPEPWRQLLDKKLTLWEPFTGVPHKSVKIEGFPRSRSEDCRKGKPYGLGDPKNVYSVKLVDGQPVLHVTGEMYAGLTSLEEFQNYHFSTEFKWGKKKWPPRKHIKRDSGILIHCTGKHGAFWNVWMRCLECQVQEGDCGDLIQLAGTSCQVRTTPETADKETPKHSPGGNWCTIGPGVGKWGAKHHGNHEIEGDWNRIEVFTVGDRAVFAVNGHPVMHLKNTRLGKYSGNKPLTKGKIQIQSEAAEIWYRAMKIRPLRKLPAELAAHFDDQ